MVPRAVLDAEPLHQLQRDEGGGAEEEPFQGCEVSEAPQHRFGDERHLRRRQHLENEPRQPRQSHHVLDILDLVLVADILKGVLPHDPLKEWRE